MEQSVAEKITIEYLKPIYGFALKRCANLHDAEDLSQEISLKIYRSLLLHNDIDSVSNFIWTVAHNALANYYRGKDASGIGIPIDNFSDILPSDEDVESNIIKSETEKKLHLEIAYLSKLQREIVIAFYYENKKQSEIAKQLGIPVGTVKWHLFEAKKDLQKGLDNMRNSSELKFNPIKFELCGTNGSVGTKGGNDNFFRSSLSQNIAYLVWKDAKTINEIADALGVSPVYVESEAEYLEEYGFLIKQGEKYLANILLDEASPELLHLQAEMYEKAAKLFANELYDELLKSELFNEEHVIIYNTDGNKDVNFALWSLIPYIASLSGEKLMDNSISFDEAATLRPDGGQNICYASVVPPDVEKPKYFDSIKNWFGPCWNANYGLLIPSGRIKEKTRRTIMKHGRRCLYLIAFSTTRCCRLTNMPGWRKEDT